MIEEKSLKEFRESGMLFMVNQLLHFFWMGFSFRCN
jgi:hypothetical protein